MTRLPLARNWNRLLWMALIFVGCADTRGGLDEIAAQNQDMISNLFIGSIQVAGKIVDPQGAPIANAAIVVKVYTNVNPFGGEYPPVEYTNQAPNGVFSVSNSHCANIEMEFTHPQYLPKTLEFMAFQRDLGSNVIEKALVSTNLTVCLQPQIVSTYLPPFDRRLTLSPVSQMWEGVAICPTGSSFYLFTRYTNEEARPTFYLGTLTNQNGCILADERKVPANVTLFVRGAPGEGVAAFNPPEPMAEEAVIMSPLAGMTEAPATGYVASIAGADVPRYFYFFASNLYGKGMLFIPILESSNTVECGIKLRLQPNGSRTMPSTE